MKIILSPAKKMITDTDSIAPDGLPEFIEKTIEIQSWLKSKSKEELKTIWKCNDKITEQNFNRLENMDLYQDRKSTRLNSSHLARSRMPSSA